VISPQSRNPAARGLIVAATSALGLELADLVPLAGGFSVRSATMRITAWTGVRSSSLADDCRKGSSLLAADDGSMSCLEVMLVDGLKPFGLDAGWVQAFPSGGTRWAGSIWRTLPRLIADRNGRVQQALGRRPNAVGGHSDVAATDGRSVAYLECKVRDRIKVTQVDWIVTALQIGAISAEEILVVQGALA